MGPSARARPTDGGRIAGWSRRSAVLVLVAVIVAICVGVVMAPPPRIDTSSIPEHKTDTALYEAIIAQVEDGEGYYSAAADLQRERGYPLRPAVTMREPTLTYAAVAAGGLGHLRAVFLAVGAITGLALLLKLERVSRSRLSWWMAIGLTAACSGAIFAPRFVVVHEAWACLLMILSMLVRRPGRSSLPSVALGFVAVAVREMAFPFMVVMAFFAWREGRLKELRQWCVASALFLILYAVHYSLVLSHTSAQDSASPGWFRLGGWPFALSTIRETTTLSLLPFWLTAIVVPLAMLGWASVRGEFASRVLALLLAFLAVFTLIGRTENWYWGIMCSPLVGAGLAFAPSAIRALVSRVGPVRRTTQVS